MIQLTITLQDDGQVQITGPIEQLLVCYGLLEAAKDAIREFGEQRSKSPAIIPIRQSLRDNGTN